MTLIDYTRMLNRLDPKPDGEAPVRHRSAIVDALNIDGTADIILSGIVVPGVSVLSGAEVGVGETVQVVSWGGDLLVLGTTRGAGLGPIIPLDVIELDSVTTFSAIPQTFRDLQIRLVARTTAALATDRLGLRFNGDAGANYFAQRWRLLNVTTGGFVETVQTSAFAAQITAANAAANFFGSAVIDIPGYADGLTRTFGRSESSAMDSATVTTNWQRNIFQFGRNGAAPITSIDFVIGTTFAAGSYAMLYGIG